jgi:putative ABC transport system permease protein
MTMESFLQDVLLGARMLRRSPGISASIILVLVLGIGANSAMFAIVDGLLLHPVHYPDPEKLVWVWAVDPQGVPSNATPANFLDWRKQSKTISDFAGWMSANFVITGEERARQVGGARVTANFFRTLGVKPVLGRTFLPDEDGLENPAAAAHSTVISYRLWKQDLGGDPNVLGRTLKLDSIAYAIVGVMPPDFQFWWRSHDVWVPASLNPQDRDYHNVTVIARLRAPRDRAIAEMAVIARSLEQAYPKSNKGWTIQVDDFQEALLSRTFRTRLLLVSGAMGLLLLIACTNVASLLLARSATRDREIAVRISLGATGARLLRQLLSEGVPLAAIGAALGLALAWLLIHLAPQIVPPNAIPGPPIELNMRITLFTLVVASVTCLICSLAPALAAAGSDVQATLKDGGRGSTPGHDRQRLRQVMVVAEVALALMLLAGAGLMIESLRNVARVDLGFDPKNVLTLRLFLPRTKYNDEQALRFHKVALQRITSIPGVKSATVGSSPLWLSLNQMAVSFDLEGASPRSAAEWPTASYIAADPDFFHTLGIPLRRGRTFSEADNETAPLVAIVSEALVRRYFPREDPIGKRMLVDRPIRGNNASEEIVRLEVVGVAGDVRRPDLSSESIIYVPHEQNIWGPWAWFAARTELSPIALGSAVRAELMSIDPEQPIEQAGTMEQMLTDQLAQPRFQTQLMGAFALMALVLAAIGIYGVNAYAVVQRTHEIGVRMALGATSGDVIRDVIGQGMRLTAMGIGIGILGALAIASLLKSVLVGISATDPITLFSVAVLLAIVAALACFIPARKATRIDPAVALRPQ